MNDVDADRLQKIDRLRRTILGAIENSFDAAKIDQALGAGGARQMCNKNVFLHRTRRIAIDHGVFLGVQTPAVAGLGPVTSIWQPSGVAVIANRENFAIVRGRDHRPDVETRAGRTLRERVREVHINFTESRPLVALLLAHGVGECA